MVQIKQFVKRANDEPWERREATKLDFFVISLLRVFGQCELRAVFDNFAAASGRSVQHDNWSIRFFKVDVFDLDLVIYLPKHSIVTSDCYEMTNWVPRSKWESTYRSMSLPFYCRMAKRLKWSLSSSYTQNPFAVNYSFINCLPMQIRAWRSTPLDTRNSNCIHLPISIRIVLIKQQFSFKFPQMQHDAIVR